MILDQSLLDKLPLIKNWITSTLEKYSSESKPLSEFKFNRLPLYYSETVLSSAKVVPVNRVPIPPLTALGLTQFKNFEDGNYVGITFKDTYFLVRNQIFNESLHFHELVHMIQWKYLGIDKFLIIYGIGLLQNGYSSSPLELIAYKHQKLFEQKIKPYDVEKNIKDEIDNIIPAILDKNLFSNYMAL
jgi:hypothetical protein